MGVITNIGWTDGTWNVATGCDKVSEGCEFCVDESTLILMADFSQKPISEIKVGDKIFSIEEYSSNQYREYVKAKVEKKKQIEKDAFEITTLFGSITCSEDHPFLVRGSRSWVIPKIFKVAHTKLSCLALHPYKTIFSKKYMQGYIAGVTDGDGTFRYEKNWGSVWKKESPQCYWRIAVCDKQILQRIINFYKSLFKKTLSIQPFYEGNDKHQPAFKVESRSQNILSNIIDCLQEQPDQDYYRGYLSGMFDAEGGLTKYKLKNRKHNRVTALHIYQIKKPEIISKIQIALEKTGFSFTKNRIGFTLLGGTLEKIKFLSLTTPALLRKGNAIFGMRGAHYEGLITGIKYLGKRKLIDIQTSSKTFVANGFIVHNCYMMRDGERYNRNWNGTVTKTKTVFTSPLKWQTQRNRLQLKWNDGTISQKEIEKLMQLNQLKRIFTSSLTDVFHEQIDSYRHEVYDIIKKCPEFQFQILTKRIERVPANLPPDWGNGYKNVWLMTTCENQQRWNERIPVLQSIPAKIRGVSIEPILTDIDILPLLKRDGSGKPLIHWIILGGESGNDTGKWKYRKSRLEWYENILGQAQAAGIPVFIKQLGTALAKKLSLKDRHGTNISEFPQHLQVREFPLE